MKYFYGYKIWQEDGTGKRTELGGGEKLPAELEGRAGFSAVRLKLATLIAFDEANRKIKEQEIASMPWRRLDNVTKMNENWLFVKGFKQQTQVFINIYETNEYGEVVDDVFGSSYFVS